MSRLLLEGVRVLDLTMVVAGPYATQVLADLGAEVIKIEGPVRYDQFRGPRRPQGGGRYPGGDPGERPYNRAFRFNEMNRNKLGISIDLRKAEGVALFKKLVCISDVVMENYSPRVMKNFGLDYGVLRDVKPEIIMVSMPGFGSSGPYRDYVANGPGIDAMSGVQSLTGYPDRPPLKTGGSYCDQNSALHAVFAVLSALFCRRRTGRGQHIDVAMLETLPQLIGEAILDYTMNGRVQGRMGNRHPFMAPHGCYRCRGEDSWVTIAIGSDEEWQRFCGVLGDPPWAQEERFNNILGRWQHQDELDRLIEAWTREHDHHEVMYRLQEAGVAAGAVLNAKEILEDPHLRERGFFEEVTHPEAGTAPYTRLIPQFSATPTPIRRPAPCFAQHNGFVFGELLGLSSPEVQALTEKAVISAEPLV